MVGSFLGLYSPQQTPTHAWRPSLVMLPLGRLHDSMVLFVLFCCDCTACGISGPWTRIEPWPAAVKASSLNQWTAREVPSFVLFFLSLKLKKNFFLYSSDHFVYAYIYQSKKKQCLKKKNTRIYLFMLKFFEGEHVPYGIWDLSSQSRDQTHVPWGGSTES